jgi:hypothetical protein
VAVALDLEVELLGQRVHDRHADAVEPAGHLVTPAVAELAACVEDGQDDLSGRPLLLLVHVDGDAAAVVRDGHPVVRVQADLDRVAVPGQRLVDGVVHDLVDEMVQAALTRGADVHAGPLPNGLEALEDRDVRGLVACRAGSLPLWRRVLTRSLIRPVFRH